MKRLFSAGLTVLTLSVLAIAPVEAATRFSDGRAVEPVELTKAVANGPTRFNKGRISQGPTRFNDGNASDGPTRFNDGQATEGPTRFNDGRASDGPTRFNDGNLIQTAK